MLFTGRRFGTGMPGVATHGMRALPAHRGELRAEEQVHAVAAAR